jgi:hypothetical protein
MHKDGRYRLRYRLRTLLPSSLGGLFFPKGKSDCGNHVFYKESDESDRCLYCQVGERRPSQFEHSEDIDIG